MNKDELKNLIQISTKEAIAETIDELETDIVNGVKAELLPVLQSRKDKLIQRLTNEIATTNSLGVKAGDYLYILLVKIVDKIFAKIEAAVIA